MKLGRRQALFLLCVAFAWGANAETAALAKPTANPGENLRRLLQASTMSTRDLHNGFDRLKRVCEYGAKSSPALPETVSDTVLITSGTRNELRDLTNSLDLVLRDYKNSSRISREASCRFMPSVLMVSGICSGFQGDNRRLARAAQTATQLTQQAQERLDLYDQYRRLEHQGCTRAGFALRLWENEKTALWPLLMDSPTALRSLLQNADDVE